MYKITTYPNLDFIRRRIRELESAMEIRQLDNGKIQFVSAQAQIDHGVETACLSARIDEAKSVLLAGLEEQEKGKSR